MYDIVIIHKYYRMYLLKNDILKYSHFLMLIYV